MSLPHIILDLSRLLSRTLHATPTGVDRVEMAYARGFLTVAPDRLSFAAVHPLGQYGRLSHDAVRRFLDVTEVRWEAEGRTTAAALRRSALQALYALRPRSVPAHVGQSNVYLQTSPHHLTNERIVQSILRREAARFVCMVHDLIPLEYPEYARPQGAEQHRQRIRTIVRHAAAIITNSHATLDSLRPWLPTAGTAPRVAVAHLGSTPPPLRTRPAAAPGRPYFVCLGTIEPRKNHLLLLNIWRRMSERHGADNIPRLVLIGRRGWENEQIVDMLERCPALVGCVEEHGGLSDRMARDVLQDARALLMPSFAEGYGMPVNEALEMGVPVICSDLPALREVGQDAACFLDPLDGPGWHRAILDFADPLQPDRTALLGRIAAWSPPCWDAHIAIVNDLVTDIAA